MNRGLFVAVVLLLAVAIVGGIWAVGGPSHARMQKRDVERLSDLRNVADYVRCRLKGVPLPDKLPAPGYCDGKREPKRMADAVTGEPYIYKRVADDRFTVCATFETPQVSKENLGAVTGRSYWFRELEFNGQLGCLRVQLDAGRIISY